MSVLKSLETKIAGLVEGAFGRAFRSELRPVEIARKLAREMEEHKAISVSRVYVPNEYAVYVSPEDRERFVDYEDALVKELEGYLLEHARLEKLALLSRPQVVFHTDDRLSLGEFGIQARLVKPAADDRAEPEQGEAGHTMIYSADRLGRPAGPPPRTAKALVVSEGRRLVVARSGAVIGRSRDCDIVLGDSNVSRRHAEVRPTEDGWTIVDLDSTNGVTVNGRRIRGSAPLRGGERIELGTSKVRFELE
jgi:FhaA, N-terminal domain/FHA domain